MPLVVTYTLIPQPKQGCPVKKTVPVNELFICYGLILSPALGYT